jgi:hypothetical protein
MTTLPAPPLRNLQVEIINLLKEDIPEVQLIEIKALIARYLLEKARDATDRVWDEKVYTQATIDKLLAEEVH